MGSGSVKEWGELPMRIKRLLRALCGSSLSGNSYLAMGGFLALLALVIPVAGPVMATAISGVVAMLAAFFVTKILLASAALL